METKAKRLTRRVALGALALAWVAAVGFGWNLAMKYETTPGEPSRRVDHPATKSSTPFSCVIVAHPLCPCTKATLRAMREVVETYPGKFSCHVVFAGSDATALGVNWELAKAIPGATLDSVSPEAARKRFDAHTSGQTFAFDSTGKLLFSGGITGSRGLDDPRFALNIFRELLKGKTFSPTPVYGCAL